MLNATGIEGRYDITLSFGDLATIQSPPPTQDTAPNDDPGGVPIPLQEAVKKQLGLKLQLQKRPVPGLVIDHVRETPTPN